MNATGLQAQCCIAWIRCDLFSCQMCCYQFIVQHVIRNVECSADDVKKGFSVHFADTYEDVYKVALDYEDSSL